MQIEQEEFLTVMTHEAVHAAATQLSSGVLARFGTVRIRVHGSSMLPALRPGDDVEIASCGWDVPVVGDIIAFQRNGRLFVHRVTGRAATGQLVTQGDAVSQADAPVCKGELLGTVRRVERGGTVLVPRTSFLQRAAARLFSRSRHCAAVFLKFASL